MFSPKLLILSTVLLALAGCSYLSDGNKVSVPNTRGANQPPLRTPPGMDISYNTLYPIPTRIYPLDVKQVNITPPGLPKATSST